MSEKQSALELAVKHIELSADNDADQRWAKEARAELASQTAALRAARAFIREIFELADWPDGGDIDGFELQDAAVKHGFLIPETRTEPCGEGCNCDTFYSGDEWKEGVTCYRMSAALSKVLP